MEYRTVQIREDLSETFEMAIKEADANGIMNSKKFNREADGSVQMQMSRIRLSVENGDSKGIIGNRSA